MPAPQGDAIDRRRAEAICGLAFGIDRKVGVPVSSAQPESPLLLRPIERQGANEPADSDAGGDIAVGDRGDDARRQERERRQEADVARDLLFAFGDLLERLNALYEKIIHPGSGLGDSPSAERPDLADQD